jgi:hypothetical protein
MRAGAVTGYGPCGDLRRSLGVYVVGAIAPADRSAVESHLGGCVECRDELAGLAGLPALLGRVPGDDVAALIADGPDELPSRAGLDSLLSRSAGVRRRRLWPLIAGGVAAGLIAGAGAVAASGALNGSLGRGQLPSAAAVHWAPTVSGSNSRTHASATVRYLGRPGGIELDVQVSGIPPGTMCELQVINARGIRVASGTWIVAGGHQGAWYPASSSVPLSGARGFVITSGKRTLVTVPVR